MPNTFQLITDVQNFIAKDELSDAINLLCKLSDNDDHLREVIIQSARKHRIETAFRKGIIPFAEVMLVKNQIVSALLDICREIQPTEKESIRVEEHFLQIFPRGPLVEGHLINERIIETYARLIRPDLALMYINRANQLRKAADPNDDRVTIIEPYTLISPLHARPIDFWLDAFHEARLHGPRMLAALLYALPDEQFSNEVKQYKEQLLSILKNHKQ